MGMGDIWPEMPQHLSRETTELFRYEITSDGTMRFLLNTALFLVNLQELAADAHALTLSWGVKKQQTASAKWVLWNTHGCRNYAAWQDLHDFADPVQERWGRHDPLLLEHQHLTDDVVPAEFQTSRVEVSLDTGDCLVAVLGVQFRRYGVPFARLIIDIGTRQEDYDRVDFELRSELVMQEASLQQFFKAMSLKLQRENTD
jgi:hypothetical protein